MSGQDPMLDRDDVLRLLADLEREAEVDGVRVELFVVGGAAMVLAYNLDRITGDLDAVFEPKSVVYRLAARVAEQSDLSIDSEWLNDGVKGFMPGADPNATVFLDRPHLSVSIASPRYMFVLKAMAARESDEDDLRVLYRLCEFASASEALDTVETAYPAHPIKPATQYLIEGIAHDTLSKTATPSTTAASNVDAASRGTRFRGWLKRALTAPRQDAPTTHRHTRPNQPSTGRVWVPPHTRNGKRVGGYWRNR